MGSDINIFEEDFWKISKKLEKLLQETNSKAVILIDKAGQVITSVGEMGELDLASFATLSAADFAATSQLATLIGEETFSTIFHQGENFGIYISLVADKLILAIVFDKKTTLGLVRIKAVQTSKELEAIINEIYERISTQMKPSFGKDFLDQAESELDNLFK